MQTENTEGNVQFTDNSVPPQNPVITSKPGYLTSQFGLTAVITVICAIAMWFGYTIKPEQIEGYLALVERIAAMVIPFLTLLGTAVAYINSRGKISSNKINANAAIQVAQVAQTSDTSIKIGKNVILDQGPQYPRSGATL